MLHESLLGRIRRAARGNGWDHETVAVLARVLGSEGVLDSTEVAWLEDAGPAWTEDVD
jgi:hypothetical protein